jgi:hypothetical protein
MPKIACSNPKTALSTPKTGFLAFSPPFQLASEFDI